MKESIAKLQEILFQINQNDPILWAFFLFILSILIGFLLRLVFYQFLKSYAKREKSKFVKSALFHLDRRTMFFFPILVFWALQPAIEFPEPYDTILYKITQAILLLNFGWLLLKLLDVLEDLAHEYYQEELHDYIKERKVRTQIEFFKRVTGVLIVLIVIASVLMTFDGVRKIGTTMLTSAGVAGVIIGIAAQKTLANVIAGIQIAFTQPIKIDDSVIVENEWGTIEEITLTYVVVRVWDKRRLVLPITYFVERPFQNWTRSSAELLGTIMLYVDYSLPIDSLRDQLSKILAEEQLWDQQASVVQVVDTTERTMVLRVLVSSDSAPNTWTLRCSVREKLINYIQDNHPEALPKSRLTLSNSVDNEN